MNKCNNTKKLLVTLGWANKEDEIPTYQEDKGFGHFAVDIKGKVWTCDLSNWHYDSLINHDIDFEEVRWR